MRRGNKKWISLQLIRHKEGLKNMKKQKKSADKATPDNSGYIADNFREKVHLINQLNYAWQNSKKVEIVFLRNEDKIRCESKIETIRNKSPQIILQTGQRLEIAEIMQVEIYD